MIETFDIQININVSAETEKDAEQKVAELMQFEMTKPALERSVNSWDYIVFIEEGDDEQPIGV